MRGRALLGVLLAIAVLAGYPYASLIINRILGTSTVVLTEHNGQQRTLIIGPDAPRPDWLPILPGALIVQAGHWVPSPGREVAGDLELLTHNGVDAIKRFYADALNAAGFDTHDIGYGPLTAPAAASLGVANTLQGHRVDDDITITVTTNAATGLIFPSRTVQIHWQRWDRSLLREQANAAAPR